VGGVGIMAEYVVSAQHVQRNTASARLENRSWQVAGSYVLTGENASASGILPKHPIDGHASGLGAVELVARYSQLKIDRAAFPVFADPLTAARVAAAWAAGANWHLNRNAKFMLDYEQTRFTGGGGTGNRETERAILGRFEIFY
jgi:phosphate-selective porin OprO/OprP